MFRKFKKNQHNHSYSGRKSTSDKLRTFALILLFLVIITAIVLYLTRDQWLPSVSLLVASA